MIRQNYKAEIVDLTQSFITEEYDAFPFCDHDDMLDALDMINHKDLRASFPKSKPEFNALGIGGKN